MTRQHLIGITEIAAGSICFAFLGIFGKLAFQSGMSVGQLLTYRFIIASIVLWIFLIVFRRKFIRLTLRDIAISAGCARFSNPGTPRQIKI
ncbi:MAG: hypothetical protein EOP06_23540 [Proteobacteria bacterium]|nr:MAG: hypothetical protein EOP06_23540 [Pseudomonadota bacterium]